MIALIWVALLWNANLVVGRSFSVEENLPKVIVVGAGAAGISAAAKLLENGYTDVLILEAQNRIGGRVFTVPFGKNNIDLGGQWCEGNEGGNVVYELVKDDFEFGDTAINQENTHSYSSDGNLVDRNKFTKLMNLSDSISFDYETMAKFNKSFGEFFESHFEMGLQNKEFEDVDKELADRIVDYSEVLLNILYASESWFDVSAKMISQAPLLGYTQLTWKEHGYKIVFDFLTKKLPDPSKALPIDDKIHFNKEVTNIDWTTNEVVVKCADGSEYRADHVIVTVSLGFLKQNHLTLFTPPLPERKVNAIENTGFGTLGKIFLEFEEPFWPTDVNEWAAYTLLWRQEDKDEITGTDKEWLTELYAFERVDAQPNIIGAFLAGKNIKRFEEMSDDQLVDDCMWMLEKFLAKTLPRPINMQRSRWMTNKYFLGSYSFPSMDTQRHNVVYKDWTDPIYSNDSKPILLIAGEATDEFNSGYVHGAVASGWRASSQILDFYNAIQHNSKSIDESELK